MSSIVPILERPSRPFIEAFWIIFEGITLLLKGTFILCAAVILNAGLLFARAHNLLTTPALCFIIALNEIHRLFYGTAKSSPETVEDCLKLDVKESDFLLGEIPNKFAARVPVSFLRQGYCNMLTAAENGQPQPT